MISGVATTSPRPPPGRWSFDSGAEAFDYLAAGETLILEYTVKATDDNGTPASDTETVTITITGTNDAPVIPDGPDAVGLNETDAGLSTNGTLTISDVDTTDVVTASIDSLAISGTSDRGDAAAPSDAALLAMFSINPAAILDGTENSDTLSWTFDSGHSLQATLFNESGVCGWTHKRFP